jgi:hypothetical protein
MLAMRTCDGNASKYDSTCSTAFIAWEKSLADKEYDPEVLGDNLIMDEVIKLSIVEAKVEDVERNLKMQKLQQIEEDIDIDRQMKHMQIDHSMSRGEYVPEYDEIDFDDFDRSRGDGSFDADENSC